MRDWNGQINLRCGLRGEVTQFGFRPMATVTVSYQFDRSLQGRMTYNLSRPSSLLTNIAYTNDNNHLSSSIQLGTRSSYISLSYTRSFPEANSKIRGAVRMGSLGGMVELSVEKKLTDFSHIGGTLLVGVPQGVHLKIKLLRGQQTFFFPIYLSDNLNPSAVLYGAILPFAAYYIIRKLIIEPIIHQQKLIDVEKTKEECADKMAQKKSEAEKAVELMRESYDRCVELEERKSGLVIIKAMYGKLQTSAEGEIKEHTCIDVTIPVQSLVKDSKLILPETSSKSGLPGFYDPIIGEQKKLYLRYKFRGRLHQVFVSDTEPVRLPQQKHIMPEESSISSSASRQTSSSS